MEIIEISVTLGGSTPTGKNYQNARADVKQRGRLHAEESVSSVAVMQTFRALRKRTKVMFKEAMEDAKDALLNGDADKKEALSIEEAALLKKLQAKADEKDNGET